MIAANGAFGEAWRLLISLDPDLISIVGLSLRVSLSAVALAALVALPLGAALAVHRFWGRRALIILLDAFMGLPPVVVGLVVYLALARSGPLGGLGWLFTPRAMILAQLLLVLPILAALTREVVEAEWEELGEQLRSLGVSATRAVPTLLWDGRYRLMTALLAGFGRAIAEVGAVLIVGGNIAHLTRVMTTAIALETSKGDLALALGLGIVLILLAVAVNAGAHLIRHAETRIVRAAAGGAR
ncbi:MAG: ABC transporter permease [Planctomycetota bacterium]|jgi:tungstate transport system permease protein